MTSGCEALDCEYICLSGLMTSKFLQHMLDVGSQNYVVNVLLFSPQKNILSAETQFYCSISRYSRSVMLFWKMCLK